MRTILEMLKKAGGWHPGLYLKIENQPYMELVIEAVNDSGPRGLPTLPVAHYGEQNGDYYRNDYVGVEQWSRNIIGNHYVSLEMLHKQHERFAKTWDNNLRLQGFAEAFDPNQHVRG